MTKQKFSLCEYPNTVLPLIKHTKEEYTVTVHDNYEWHNVVLCLWSNPSLLTIKSLDLEIYNKNLHFVFGETNHVQLGCYMIFIHTEYYTPHSKKVVNLLWPQHISDVGAIWSQPPLPYTSPSLRQRICINGQNTRNTICQEIMPTFWGKKAMPPLQMVT